MYRPFQPNNYYSQTQENGNNGGTIEIVDMERRFKPIPNVMEGDFTSQYPSIIIAYNISPETIAQQGIEPEQTKCFIRNYKSGMPEEEMLKIRFLRSEIQKGVYPELCDRLLTMRK